ncbi:MULTISPECIES: WS/DGAT/MGAT family O-acyltransferase [Rhodococcus]|uniref:WS/DGAT/MGAT family O-acyltransferase n=1 Tax=Rhodococcus TaxID=1827 RepID=UPI0013592EF0|nr:MULTISPECIES: wax ester/triacylglycerol synthase family O-acyltransferase [Rhodococcus]KAF0963836.1 putative diacylglycerol O-acyltransferase [Rhodococcus sp. T7]QQZ18233.1 wax ester/triacylglycerol synthase family O-acyltransferase [Rhodococcus sp. 21391]UOT08162.1 wax ester/triacylglycerol synthase family O-acyltransferase [Rhodococcus opacus]
MLLPMSPTDSLFLLGESREHPLHVGGLALFAPPDDGRAADVRAMLEAASRSDQVAPLLRKRAARSVTSLGQWGWDTDTEIDLGHHIRRDALPQPGGMTELMSLVSRLHGSLLDRSRPLWEMHLIEGLADGRFAVYMKIHHALADGASAMKFLRRALSEDPQERDMPAPWQPTPTRTPPSSSVASVASAARNPLELPGAALSAARGALGEVAGLVPAAVGTVDRALRARGGPLSLTAPHTVLNVPIGGARHFAGRTWPLERLRMIAKHADATINDVVLALSSGALRTFLDGLNALPTDPLIAMVPVSLRGGGREGEDGNRLGVLMCNMGTHLADAGHRLEAVRTSMNEGKAPLRGMSPAQVLAMSALGAAPLAAEMLAGRRGPWRPAFNVVISNVAGPLTPRYWNGARLDGLYPLSIPTDGQALNITCTSTDDQIVFGLTGCRRTLPQLTPILDHLDTELDALERVVGL